MTLAFDAKAATGWSTAVADASPWRTEVPALLDGLGIGAFVCRIEADPADPSPVLRLVFVNQAAAAATGLSAAELVDRILTAHFPLLISQELPAAYAEVARTGLARHWAEVDYADARAGGGVYSVQALPLPEHHVAVVFDHVSARHLAEQTAAGAKVDALHAEADALHAEIATQRAEIVIQDAELADQRAELKAQRDELEAQKLALVDMHERLLNRNESLDFELKRRVRAEGFRNDAQLLVLRHLASADTLEEALRSVLGCISATLGFEVGEVWLVDDATGRLRRQWRWERNRLSAEPDSLPGHGATLGLGDGLPGRVWQAGELIVVKDLQRNQAFVGRDTAGLNSGIGFPIGAGDAVFGAVTFYSRHDDALDHEQRLLGQTLSGSLGQFFQRWLAQAALNATHAELESAYLDIADQASLLKLQNVELARLAVLKDDFLSVVSHELRTPLTVIKNAGAILHKGTAGALNETQDRFVSLIGEHVGRLNGLVDDLLDFQKLESGTFRAALSTNDLNVTLHTVTQSFAQMLTAKQLTLSTDLRPPTLPSRYDAGLVGQVLLNLLSNAAKFTAPGGAIGLRSWQEGDEVYVSVSDTGIGIPPEDLERIFEKFVQVGDRLSRESGGTGLGLAICRQLIVDSHGGRIWAESLEGQGSTFTFTLPAA